MKFDFTYKNFKAVLFNFLLIFILLFSGNSQSVYSVSMDSNFNDLMVIEELRLKVPFKFKEAWLQAEKEVWEPWLSHQNGFLGRQIFWNKEKEEALILVSWKNKKLWKSISMREVKEIQEKFEKNVQTSLKIKLNPFELIYEGELDKQEWI